MLHAQRAAGDRAKRDLYPASQIWGSHAKRGFNPAQRVKGGALSAPLPTLSVGG